MGDTGDAPFIVRGIVHVCAGAIPPIKEAASPRHLFGKLGAFYEKG
jgi:hypothetical protein